MGWGFRVTCPDCGHGWEGVETRRFLGPGSMLKRPDAAEVLRSWFCPRCYFRLILPRTIERDLWRKYYAAFLASGLAAYPFLRDVADKLDATLSADRNLIPLSEGLEPVDCPGCRQPFEESDLTGSDRLVCPNCRGRGTVLEEHNSHCSLLGDRHGFD